MATTTNEVVYVPENVNGKGYMEYHRFRLRVCICSGVSMLIVLSGAVALIVQILNFSTFLAQKYDLAEGDMRVISVSTAFCEEISLGKDASNRNLWILSSSKTSSQLRRTNTSTEVFVSKHHYWYKGFYLLEGSSIAVNAASDTLLKLFIFKDKKRLNEWIRQNDDTRKSEAGESGETNAPTAQPTKISYSLNVRETGNYFVLFKYSKGTKDFARMKLVLNINRKVYDLQSSVYSCNAKAGETCSSRLLFISSEVGVLEVTDASSEHSYHSTRELVATWQCKPRVWFYVAVFVGPILLAIVASCVFYFFYITRKREKHLYKLAARRQQALRRASGSGRSSSFSNRSLNGSVRRPPSRTPSARSLGNQTDLSRAPCLQPVVTTMYTGNAISASEDSGHDTDEESKQNNFVQDPDRKSSVDGMSLDSIETTVSRKPSFSTFQGSEDETAVVSRHSCRKSRDGYRTSRDRQEMRDKTPTGRTERNPPARRFASDESFDRVSRTLPNNRSNQAAHVLYQQVEVPASRNSKERLHDLRDGRLSSSERARKPRSDYREMQGNISKGALTMNLPTRRYSSDELYHCEFYEQACKTLPQNQGNAGPTASRNPTGRLRDSCDGGISAKKKARKPSAEERTGSLRDLMTGKVPNGTILSHSAPTRRNSSDELYDRAMCKPVSKSLPRNRGITEPADDQLTLLERYLLPNKPASLPSLQYTDVAPDFQPYGSSSDHGDENTVETQKIKMRTHSGRRREMGWTPRLSMVSESEV